MAGEPKIDREEAVRMRQMGCSYREIGERFGATKQAVYFAIGPVFPPGGASSVEETEELKAEARRILQETMSIKLTAWRIGVPYETARRALAGEIRKLKAQRNAQMMHMRDGGMSIDEIAREFGIVPQTVHAVLGPRSEIAKAALATRAKQRAKKKMAERASEAKRLLQEMGSTSSVAVRMGLSSAVVAKLLQWKDEA